MPRTARPSHATHLLGLAALAGACLLLSACASSGGSEESSQTQSEKPAATKGVAPPAGSALARVEMRMRPEQVRQIMGEPDSEHWYPGAIWKNFIPFYYGADSGNRVEYGYAGQGRVVFSVNRWTSRQNVVRIDYDPNEDGQ